MKKQSLIKGTFILGMAGIIAKFLGLFFRFPLVMLIGDDGIGYYQMSYPLYTFFIAAASGIPVAVSKMVSERNAVGDRNGIILILRKSILLMIILGGGFTVFLLIFSKELVKFLNWDSHALYSLMGIAFAPLFISVVSPFRGFFQGLQNMTPTAVSQILEQIGRVIVGVGLAYLFLNKGVEYSAGGAAFGATFGAIMAGIYLFCMYMKAQKQLGKIKVKNDSSILTKIICIAIPVSLGSAVGSIMSLLDSILVPQNLLKAGFDYRQATELYGRLTGKAFVLVNVPLTLSMALCISIVPMISEAYILNKKFQLASKVDTAIKMSMIIAIPSFLGLFFMANPIMRLIFPGHSSGSDILKYLSISIPFIVLFQTTTAILQGVGKYLLPVVNLFLGCMVKVFITIHLVPMANVNIYGAVLGTIVGYLVATMLNVIAFRVKLKIKLKYYNILIKPAYASIIMIIGVVFIYGYVYNKTMNNIVSCGISILLGVSIYFILIIVFGIFSYNDVKRRFVKR